MLPRRNITFPILPLLVSRTGNDCIPSPLQSGNSLELRGVVAISQTRGEISFPAAKNKISSHLPLPFLFFFPSKSRFLYLGLRCESECPTGKPQGRRRQEPVATPEGRDGSEGRVEPFGIVGWKRPVDRGAYPPTQVQPVPAQCSKVRNRSKPVHRLSYAEPPAAADGRRWPSGGGGGGPGGPRAARSRPRSRQTRRAVGLVRAQTGDP